MNIHAGMTFSTVADGRRYTYRVTRMIRLLPYDEDNGYRVAACPTSRVGELKQVRFNRKAPMIADASQYIGMHGGVWYISTPRKASLAIG